MGQGAGGTRSWCYRNCGVRRGPPIPRQDTGQAPGGALGAVGVLALATNSSRRGVAASHARPQHVPSSEGSCQEGSRGWCTCGTLSIPLPQPRAQHGPPPVPPALTHRGGGQRLPPHQLPRPQPVEEVTELALSTQPRGGEDEPVRDGAERCHGPPPRAGHAPQRPWGPLATPGWVPGPYVPSELLLLVLPSVDSRLPCRVTLVLISTAMPVSVLRRMLLRSFLGPPSASRDMG